MSTADLARAVSLLENHTFAACRGGETKISTARGIAPLLSLAENGETLAEWSCADRVVGAGAAYLYVLLAPARLYARVLSRPAAAVLARYGISATYDTLCDHIIHRTGIGICPMEAAVAACTSPAEALAALIETQNRLRNGEPI